MSSIHKFSGLISTKTGLKLFCKTAATSEIHVSGGTITSPDPNNIFNICNVNKFDEEPEFTKTLYFTPSQFDHKVSNLLTLLD